MGTVVDFCNLALARLGDRADITSISPPEGSAQADHAARFYPIARDFVLTAHDWSFASTRATLAELDLTNYSWSYVFALPNDCLAVRSAGYTDLELVALNPGSPQFEMSSEEDGTLTLLSHAETPYIRYTRRVTDPTKFPPMFAEALVFKLAADLAGPVIKGKAGMQASQAMYAAFRGVIAEAATHDANQGDVRTTFKPSAIRARGHASGEDIILERGQYRYSLPFWAQG